MTYPRMTSFSDPKGIIHIVTMFHIKAEFLWWIFAVRHSNFQMISRKKRKRLKIEFWKCLFWGPLFSLTISKWTSFSDPHSFSKQVAIRSRLLLLMNKTHTLNMKHTESNGCISLSRKNSITYKLWKPCLKSGWDYKMSQILHANSMYTNIFIVVYIKHSG